MSNILKEFKRSGFNHLTNLIYKSNKYLIHYRANYYESVLITELTKNKGLKFINIADNEHYMNKNYNDLLDFLTYCRIFKKEVLENNNLKLRYLNTNINTLIESNFNIIINDNLIKEYLNILLDKIK